MKTQTVYLFSNLLLLVALSRGQRHNGTNRSGRLFSVFQVIRFPNDGCIGSGSMNGTCYTAAECSQKGGTNGGSCAQGYGVCCTFSLTCGATSNQNCTYFTSPGNFGPGQCTLTICKSNSNICQLRLDFINFAISQPSTLSASIGKTLNGQLLPVLTGTVGVTVAAATQCLLDTFTVTNPGGNTPPVICGTNNMEHMYVDASDSCNDLDFQLGQANTLSGATFGSRSWNIKVTQYSCDYNNLAPEGCTMYLFNTAGTGTFRSYNYAGNVHLANQQQSICVRRELRNCRICWSATIATDFQVSGPTNGVPIVATISCCQYKNNGKNSNGFDCVSIPGAVVMNMASVAAPQRICGRNNGLSAQTICSNQQPFVFNFYTDNFEISGAAAILEAKAPGKGIQISFAQMSTMCAP